mgnify:CR=1 FL=1
MKDTELEAAIDEYFDWLKAEVKARVAQFETQYKGAWKKMTLGELADMAFEERLDLLAYKAMHHWKSKGKRCKGKGGDDGDKEDC